MNQIADILKLASEAQQQNFDAVLATVIRTEGSAYRRAGAMMLICEDGHSVGMISGGCLEPHIIKRAFWLTRDGANVQVYQTGDDIQYSDNGEAEQATEKSIQPDFGFVDSDLDDDSYHEMDELNFGLGCNGRVHVLFERLMTAKPFLEVIRQVRRTQQPIKIATLVRSDSDDEGHLRIGMRLNLDALDLSALDLSNIDSYTLDLDDFGLNSYTNSGQVTTLDGYNVSNQTALNLSKFFVNTIQKLSESSLDKKDTEYVLLENDGIVTEWLIQRIQPQIRLLICGAGDDVMPLVTMAKLQDWHVTVIDSRPKYATRLRFTQADIVMHLALEDIETLIELSNNAAVALMSHSLTQDRARLAILLEHANHYKYIGQLGPRYRTERLINEISATKSNPAILDEGISKLHYPIGYKLGGDGPEALALGIMAQINTVMRNQTPPAKFLTIESINSDMAASFV